MLCNLERTAHHISHDRIFLSSVALLDTSTSWQPTDLTEYFLDFVLTPVEAMSVTSHTIRIL